MASPPPSRIPSPFPHPQTRSPHTALFTHRLLHTVRFTPPNLLDGALFTPPSSHHPLHTALFTPPSLLDGARVESLPSTAEYPHAFAIVDKYGKGYTWVAESAMEKDEWFRAIDGVINAAKRGTSASADHSLLADVATKPVQARIWVTQVANLP